MKSSKLFFAMVLCLWMAGGCQRSVAPVLGIAGVSPDFLLVTTGCLALFASRRGGATLGFFAGLIEGALAGANMAAYVLSRTFGGFIAGWFTALEFEAGPIVAASVVVATTLFGQLLLMFIAPPGGIGPFLLATILLAVYNGVLAMPLYALLRRFLDPPSRRI